MFAEYSPAPFSNPPFVRSDMNCLHDFCPESTIGRTSIYLSRFNALMVPQVGKSVRKLKNPTRDALPVRANQCKNTRAVLVGFRTGGGSSEFSFSGRDFRMDSGSGVGGVGRKSSLDTGGCTNEAGVVVRRNSRSFGNRQDRDPGRMEKLPSHEAQPGILRGGRVPAGTGMAGHRVFHLSVRHPFPGGGGGLFGGLPSERKARQMHKCC